MDQDSIEFWWKAIRERDEWRTIAIAYLVHVEKAGVHEKVFEMLTDEQKAMAKDALTEYMRAR